SGPAPPFHLLEAPRPVVLEEPGERAVGEEHAARLAAGAVVGLVLGVDDALHGRAAVGTGLAVAPMDGHAVAEGGHLLGEAVARLRAQAFGPLLQRRLRGPASVTRSVPVGKSSAARRSLPGMRPRGGRQWRRPAIIRWRTRKSSASRPITRRLPSRRSPVTLRPSAAARGGSTERRKNG